MSTCSSKGSCSLSSNRFSSVYPRSSMSSSIVGTGGGRILIGRHSDRSDQHCVSMNLAELLQKMFGE